jgi:RimJ/RimL family protein N-acetyltransferase
MELRPLSEEHLPDLERLIEDPEVLHHTRIPEPAPEGFTRRWVARYEQGRRDGSSDGFAIHDDDGAFVGVALAPEIDRDGGEIELGYIVAPHARGRGVATDALRRLTKWALDEVGAKRIYLIIDVVNTPSLRVAERCGYVHEGVLRSTHLKQGRRVDASIWSRLPSDP